MLGPSTWRRESLVAEKIARVSVESRTKIVGVVAGREILVQDQRKPEREKAASGKRNSQP